MILTRRRLLGSAVLVAGALAVGPAAAPRPVGAADPRRFGAVGDGTTDDSAALQAACDASAGRLPVTLGGRRYLVGDVRLRSGTAIVGPGTLVFRRGAQHVLTVNPGTEGTPDPSENIRHIRVEDVTFEGRSREVFSEFEYQIWLSAASDVTVRRCRFHAFQGDAIMIGSGEEAGVERHNERILVEDCTFDGVNRQNRNAISVIDVRGLVIRGCEFSRCSRPDMPGPIDIEPNVHDETAVVADIEITGNVFFDNGGNVADVGLVLLPPVLRTPPRGLRIRGNSFTGSARSAVRLSWRDHDGRDEQAPLDAVVEQNVSQEATLFFCEIYGIRGVALRGNTVTSAGHAGVVSGMPEGPSADIVLSGNTWRDVGRDSSSAVIVGAADRVTVTGDVVAGAAPATLLRLFADGSSSELTANGNVLPGGTSVAELEPGHRTTPGLNTAARNGAAPVDPAVFGSPGPPG